jgi:hypothetical protein
LASFFDISWGFCTTRLLFENLKTASGGKYPFEKKVVFFLNEVGKIRYFGHLKKKIVQKLNNVKTLRIHSRFLKSVGNWSLEILQKYK